jgi:hypothetical protein
MIPVPSNKGSLFKKLGQEFKKILKVSSPGNVIESIIWGENLLQIMRNLLKTLERQEVNKKDLSSSTPSPSTSSAPEHSSDMHASPAASGNPERIPPGASSATWHEEKQSFDFIKELF